MRFLQKIRIQGFQNFCVYFKLFRFISNLNPLGRKVSKTKDCHREFLIGPIVSLSSAVWENVKMNNEKKNCKKKKNMKKLSLKKWKNFEDPSQSFHFIDKKFNDSLRICWQVEMKNLFMNEQEKNLTWNLNPYFDNPWNFQK